MNFLILLFFSGNKYVWVKNVSIRTIVWSRIYFFSLVKNVSYIFYRMKRNSFKILTWLILPVVIRLSQRLSHACLSINNFVLWNCEWLIISVIVYLIVPYYLDNRSNSRANTCANTQLLVGRVAFIRLKPMQLRLVLCWVIITVRIAFHYAINQLSFCPISFGW